MVIKLYEKYRGMEIYENREVIRFSDHNLITVGLSLGEGCGNRFNKKKMGEVHILQER